MQLKPEEISKLIKEQIRHYGNKIAQQKKKMLQDVRDEISDLAVEIASKVVEREISPRDYDGFVDEFIRNVGENN